MQEWFDNLVQQIQAMPPGRRAGLAAAAVGSLAFFGWLAFGMNGVDERVLFRDLAEDEAAKVVEALQAEKVGYRLANGGTAIYVPAAQVHEARIRLAGKGLPAGSTGFELFDRPGFGVTDFVNRVNYQRALQGELARSIEQLGAVDRARVQVAMPEKRGFVAGREQQPSASVVVRLRPGAVLERTQVRGIVHLVASSVEGLEAAKVSLVDDSGRLLAPDADGGASPEVGGALRHQAQMEKELADRVEAILEPTVGPGRVVARVHAELDWTRTESTAEQFDPNSQVARSEELSEEKTTDGIDVAEGAPGVAANAPGLPGGAPAEPSSSATRKTETINYEISKTVTRTTNAVGDVKRLDVAVLVDGQPVAEGEEFAPWDESELQSFEELARRAVGFSEERGDRITITSAPFRSLDLGDPGGGGLSPEMVMLATTALRVVGLIAALVIFAKVVAAPLLTRLGQAAPAALPATAEELEMQLAGGAAPAGDVAAAAAAAPASGPAPALGPPAGEEAVKALKVWLSER